MNRSRKKRQIKDFTNTVSVLEYTRGEAEALFLFEQKGFAQEKLGEG